MYLGRLVEVADRDSLFDAPHHPYTQALLSAVPVPDPELEADPHHPAGRCAESGAHAGGVQLPSALSDRAERVPPGRARAASDGGRAVGGMSFRQAFADRGVTGTPATLSHAAKRST